jgi:hypothetical protein
MTGRANRIQRSLADEAAAGALAGILDRVEFAALSEVEESP